MVRDGGYYRGALLRRIDFSAYGVENRELALRAGGLDPRDAVPFTDEVQINTAWESELDEWESDTQWMCIYTALRQLLLDLGWSRVPRYGRMSIGDSTALWELVCLEQPKAWKWLLLQYDLAKRYFGEYFYRCVMGLPKSDWIFYLLPYHFGAVALHSPASVRPISAGEKRCVIRRWVVSVSGACSVFYEHDLMQVSVSGFSPSKTVCHGGADKMIAVNVEMSLHRSVLESAVCRTNPVLNTFLIHYLSCLCGSGDLTFL